MALSTGCYLYTTDSSSNNSTKYYMSQISGNSSEEGSNHDFEWDSKFGSEDAIKFIGVRKQQIEELEVLSSLVPFVTASKTYLTDEAQYNKKTFKLLQSKFRLILGK